MKKIVALLLILITAIATTEIAQAQKFKLTGQIVGAEKGDTLRFDKINIHHEITPGGFDVIIGDQGKIKYSGKQEHTQYYGATYFPVNGEKPVCDKRWLPVIITEGTINITGTREHIYYCSLEGGVYDSELSKILFIEDSIGKIRGDYMKFLMTARAKKDTLAGKKYADLFNNFHRDEKVRESRAKTDKMMAAYKENNSNEYLAHEATSRLYLPLKEIKESYERFSPEIQESYYGKHVKQAIESLEVLEPGQPAPDFKLITTKGVTVTLETFKGKYLLIYHFGMCPGSFQVDKHVGELYNKHKDNLNVVSYTNSLQPIQEFSKKVKDGEKVMGMDMKPILNGMLNHPWEHEAEGKSIPENMQLNDKYKFAGLPYFIFISPDGKMIGRGFSSVFYEAGKTLENNKK